MTRPLAFAVASVIIWGWLSVLHGQTMGKFYSAGATFQTYAHPELTGWAAVALPLDQKKQNWSFSVYDVTPSAKPLSIHTDTSTGFATELKVIGPCHFYGVAMGGYATDGTHNSGVASVGPLGVCPFFKSKTWKFVGAYLRIKTTLPGSTPDSYRLGIGRTF